MKTNPCILVPLLLSLIQCRNVWAVDRNFTKRCGNCWCIADVSSTNGTCPAFDVGYYEPTEIPWVYKSFVLMDTNQTAPKLQTTDKNATCNPFPSLSSQLTQLPQSTWTTCEVPPLANSSDAVCAFVYTQPVTNLSTCINRTYQLQTFSSAAAATSAGAVVTHTRACGVCSSAQDLIAFTGTTNDVASKICGISYVVGLFEDKVAAFNKLVTCITKIGHSYECSKLWAHAIAATSQLCVSECTADEAYNGPAPQCAFSPCIKCKDNSVESTFDVYAGRIHQRSGILSNIAYNCSSISKVIQDPCDGKVSVYSTAASPTMAPTVKKNGIGKTAVSSSSSIFTTILVGWFLWMK